MTTRLQGLFLALAWCAAAGPGWSAECQVVDQGPRSGGNIVFKNAATGHWEYFILPMNGVHSQAMVTGSDGKRQWQYHAWAYPQAKLDELVGSPECGLVFSAYVAKSKGWAVVDDQGLPLDGQRIPLSGAPLGLPQALGFPPVAHLCTTEGADVVDGKAPALVREDGVALPLVGLAPEFLATLSGFGAKVAARLAEMGASEVSRAECSRTKDGLSLTLWVRDRAKKKQQVVITGK